MPESYGSFLPDVVRQGRFAAARRAAEKAKEAQNLNGLTDGESQASQITTQSVTAQSATPTAEAADANDETGHDPEAISLNHPLLLLYVKNGDTVIGKLPMVPGLKPLEEAFLVDDAQRLRAEALVKGFQGEILDLIGLRNLMAARVQLYIKDARADPDKREAKLQQAEQVLSQLQRLRTYNEMALRLEQIQRDVLEGNSAEYFAKDTQPDRPDVPIVEEPTAVVFAG